ncbi:aromatic amino acid lyase [Streptomyces naganishii]|uniref:aromatic amino acid lyase n=1 Tax=Streptomyces naganishii TaxID=285447 RepID=UPI0036A09FFD
MDGTTGAAARVSPDTGDTPVVLDGRGLGLAAVVRLADAEAVPAVAPQALERARRSWLAAARLAAGGRLYGRGTGVGAHRSVPVDAHDETEHGLRLLRSHAGGAGAAVPVRQVRAMLAIRANQLLAGGSGIQPAFVTALAEALRLRVHPAVSEYGSLGTGDLTALAQTGLTLIGERPWHTDAQHDPRPAPTPTAPGGLPGPARPVGGPAAMPGPRQADGDRPQAEAALAGLPAQWRGDPAGDAADQATITLPRQWRVDEPPAPEAAPTAGLPTQWRTTDPETPHPAPASAHHPAPGAAVGEDPHPATALPAPPADRHGRGAGGAVGEGPHSATAPPAPPADRHGRGAGGAVGEDPHSATALPAPPADRHGRGAGGAVGEDPHPATALPAPPADRHGPGEGGTMAGGSGRAAAGGQPTAPEPPEPTPGELPAPGLPELPAPGLPELPAPGLPELPAPGLPELPAPVVPGPGDALALLSSNALTLGQAALACHDLDVLLRAAHAVAALSLEAVSGSLEAYAAEVHALRPYPGIARAAAEVRRLSGPRERPGARVQDPFGFRAFPQAHGPALDAADALRRIVEVEANCPSENPLIAADGTAAHHHGGFYAAPLGLALDALNLAVLQTAQLSAARLAALGRPDLTGLPAFLAAGPASSSGTMILEYTANSALAELRACAAPASAGHAVLSHGLEEAASFASQAARQSLRAVDAYATVLACELVSAVRASRMLPDEPRAAAFAVADAALPTGTEDRPLTADVAAAAGLLRVLAGL